VAIAARSWDFFDLMGVLQLQLVDGPPEKPVRVVLSL
jgi:hypothetical protein